jgi:hypothetical protein
VLYRSQAYPQAEIKINELVSYLLPKPAVFVIKLYFNIPADWQWLREIEANILSVFCCTLEKQKRKILHIKGYGNKK